MISQWWGGGWLNKGSILVYCFQFCFCSGTKSKDGDEREGRSGWEGLR